MNTKTCNKCGVDRLITQYTKDTRNKDGLQGICLVCKKENNQKQRELRRDGLGISPVPTKTCNKCLITKDSNLFYRDSGFLDGRSSICKACKTDGVMKWRDKNKEEYNRRMREYRSVNKEAINWSRTLKRYGLTQDDYDNIVKSQNNSCAICKEKFNPSKRYVIDHSAKTNKVRGVLCYNCNRHIVLVDKGQVNSAIEYLSKTL